MTQNQEAVEDFMNEFDNVGAFTSLSKLREILDSANDEVMKTSEYSYLKGLIDGRSIYEELGGVND